VAVAHAGDGSPRAGCLFLRHPDFNVIVPHGDSDGIEAILEAVGLPEQAFITVRAEHRPALERRYLFPPEPSDRWRMGLTRERYVPPARSGSPVERLGMADLPLLLDLYTEYEDSFFLPEHLTLGVAYGVREGDKLVAAGGTHVVSRRHRIAAIGNIYTRPEARGHGHATAVTAAVVEALLAMGCDDLILNVAVTNHTAAAIYERLGFRTHCRHWELSATLRG
jgi:ribosomal protein S18 acetylase RimI-like enzyme